MGLRVSCGRWVQLFGCLGRGLRRRGGAGRGSAGGALEPREATLRGFQNYVSKVEARKQEGLSRGAYLWIDELPELERTRAYAKLKQGGVEMRRLGKDDGKGAGGMMHDWEGMVFIPGAKLEQVLAVLQDYNKHSVHYAPDVEKANIESREGD